MHAEQFRRAIRGVAGLDPDKWTDNGVPPDEISRLVGHSSTAAGDSGPLNGDHDFELRREESRCRAQDRIRPAQLAVLPLQLRDPRRITARRSGSLTSINLGPAWRT
jgi:hypothetical protein